MNVLLILLLFGCATLANTDIVSTPISIGPEWSEVKPASPFNTKFNYQSLMVQLPLGEILHQLPISKIDPGPEIYTQLGLEGRPHIIFLPGGERVIFSG